MDERVSAGPVANPGEVATTSPAAEPGQPALPARDRVVTRSILERHALERPDALCVLAPAGERWSWAQALDEAYRSAAALAARGVHRGDHVLLFLPNGLDWLRAWWGISVLGAVMVTVNTAYRGESLRHVCAESGARVIVTDDALGERLSGMEHGLDRVSPAELRGGGIPPVLDPPLEPWDVHAVNFTSGTTGPAKGVLTPYLATYMGGVNAMGEAGGLTADDRWLLDIPLFHVSGQMTALVCLSAGAGMAVRDRFAGARYWEVAAETGATHSLLVGTMASFLMSREPGPGERAHRLRVVVLAPMVDDPAAFRARFGVLELCSVYGQTEISSPLLVPPGGEIVPGSVGRPRQGVELRIVDEHDLPVPVGEAGELVVRTDRPWEMNAGYFRCPEDTVAAWRNGWFHTGDVFRRDHDHNYFYVDRIRDVLRRRGENISSFQVEREVVAHPSVLEAACVGVPAELGEHEVKIFIVPVGGHVVDPADLVAFLVPRLPRFMIPRFIEVVDELPKTQTSRVQKFDLRRRPNTGVTWDRLAAGVVLPR
ncbi:MAG TPA: AMP-binding protein [Amycolatopsis sp.]|nr:AMP-binding protein [Amycolatopsis sp.]